MRTDVCAGCESPVSARPEYVRFQTVARRLAPLKGHHHWVGWHGLLDEVLEACADERRPHGWIDGQIKRAYLELHRRGWAHSVETRNEAGELVGGVYGVGIRRLFAGESMFHTETDASKAALAHAVELLRRVGCELFDVQWMTPHLSSLGAIDLSRSDYLRRLEHAIRDETPASNLGSPRSSFVEGNP